MSVNYTEEQVELMKTKYGSNPTRQTVEELAEELNKSVKSVIGKLSREGVYQKSVYKKLKRGVQTTEIIPEEPDR